MISKNKMKMVIKKYKKYNICNKITKMTWNMMKKSFSLK